MKIGDEVWVIDNIDDEDGFVELSMTEVIITDPQKSGDYCSCRCPNCDKLEWNDSVIEHYENEYCVLIKRRTYTRTDDVFKKDTFPTKKEALEEVTRRLLSGGEYE